MAAPVRGPRPAPRPRWLPRFVPSLRVRLTAWYGGLLALTLLGSSMLVYLTLERNLSTAVDDQLRLRESQIHHSLLGPNIGLLLQPEDVPPDQVQAGPLDEFAAPGIYVQVINARGGVIVAPANLGGGELPVLPSSLEAIRDGHETMDTATISEANVRVLTVPIVARGEVVGAVQVGQSLSTLESTMTQVGRLLALGSGGALALAIAIGWLLAGRALNPVARITATARHIAATGDYRQRLAVEGAGNGGGDELAYLASTFNDMIARLEQVLESQRRLLADTSHELRNPLTVIRGNLALLRREDAPRELRREAVNESDDEAARMSRLVNELLLLARADAGELPSPGRQRVDLVELAREATAQTAPRADGRTLRVDAAGLVEVLGDRDRLKQLLANLLDNAVRHTSGNGRIDVSVRVAASTGRAQQSHGAGRLLPEASMHRAVLSVADNGVGIATEHMPHLFERFYRVDRARSRADGGTGLGLAIALYVAQAHGGTIEARSDGPGRGSVFEVRLPLAPPEVAAGQVVSNEARPRDYRLSPASVPDTSGSIG